MKRSLRLAGLVAFIALPVMASAQESTRPVSFGVSGGLSLPVGDTGDGLDAGFNVTGHLMFKPASLTNLGFRLDAAFDRFGYKASDNANFRSISGSANAVYSFPQSSPGVIRPYVIGGVGMYNLKTTADAGGINFGSESVTKVGAQGGVGINFQLSGFTTFLEAKYVNIFTEGSSTSFIPVTFGIRF